MRVAGAAVAGSAEMLAVLVVFRSPAWWPLALAGHAVASVLAGWAFGGGRAEDRLFALALVLALPGVGVAGLIVLSLWFWWSPPSGPSPFHAGGADLPEPDVPRDSMDRVFAWLQTQVSVRPIADVVRSGDPAMQRWGVQILGKRGDGVAVDLLRELLSANTRELQIAASTTLQRIEERLVDRIGRAQTQTREAPTSANVWSSLGDACCAYQQSHLLEPVMEHHWLTQADGAYRRALALEGDRATSRLALAGVLTARARLTSSAAAASSMLEEAEILTRAVLAAVPTMEAAQCLAEILFHQQRWTDLRQACRDSVAAGRTNDLLAWWAA